MHEAPDSWDLHPVSHNLQKRISNKRKRDIARNVFYLPISISKRDRSSLLGDKSGSNVFLLSLGTSGDLNI
jgi:hypothetical protein